MVATAADLPPELFPIIIGHLFDSSFLSIYCRPPVDDAKVSALKDTKQHLSACSLTCLWWAQQCRPVVFQMLTLRSADDVRILQGFLAHPSPRLPSIQAYIQVLGLQQSLDESTWIHRVFLDPTLSRLPRDLTIIRPSSTAETLPRRHISHVGESTSGRRSLFADVSRTLPPSLCRCDLLVLRDAYFNTLRDVFAALKGIHIERRLAFCRVTWGGAVELPHQPPLGLLISYDHHFGCEAVGCTNSLELAWHGFCTWMSTSLRNLSHTHSKYWLLLHSIDHEPILDLVRRLYNVAASQAKALGGNSTANVGSSYLGDSCEYHACSSTLRL